MRRRVFKSKNSQFEDSENLPTEIMDGQNVVLYGKVREELFPGPPNYESINDGDQPQFYWILYTNSPVGIVGRSMEDNSLCDHGKSCSFQLCLSSDIYDNRIDILNKYVEAEGQIFLGHTGHHKTKALLEVKEINVKK